MSRVQSPEAAIKRAIPVFVLCLLLTSAAAKDPGQYGECSQSDREAYIQAIQRKLTSNWRVPTQYRSVSCTVVVSQNFRGEVLNAGVEDCGDDPDLIKSIEDPDRQPKCGMYAARDTVEMIAVKAESEFTIR